MRVRNNVLEIAIVVNVSRFECSSKEGSRPLIFLIKIHSVCREDSLHEQRNAPIYYFFQDQMEMIRNKRVCAYFHDWLSAFYRFVL